MDRVMVIDTVSVIELCIGVPVRVRAMLGLGLC